MKLIYMCVLFKVSLKRKLIVPLKYQLQGRKNYMITFSQMFSSFTIMRKNICWVENKSTKSNKVYTKTLLKHLWSQV